jgi:hypothetical protein
MSVENQVVGSLCAYICPKQPPSIGFPSGKIPLCRPVELLQTKQPVKAKYRLTSKPVKEFLVFREKEDPNLWALIF